MFVAIDAERRRRDATLDILFDAAILMVAHRLSTLRAMDRIIFVADGRLVEQGSYDELMARGGGFSAMLRAEEAA